MQKSDSEGEKSLNKMHGNIRTIILKGIYYIPMGLTFLILLFLNIFYHDQWLDSDMAAEMVFSRLLEKEGHIFAARDWYYSTEFRVLYTQLIMAPLFHVMNNWHLIRGITNVLTYAVMLISYFYMMKPLKVDKRWIALTGSVLLLPFSETMITHMQMGNTYMPHVILAFIFFGMFLRLSEGTICRNGQKIEITLLYLLLAVICGVSGVRYLLAIQCPLAIAGFLYLLKTEEFVAFRDQFGVDREAKVCFRRIWKSRQAKYLYYALLGLAGGVIGYGINVLWVSRNYVFQTYGATNFIAVYQGIFWERLQNAFGSLLMLFGYIPDKSFLSLRGIVTVAAFVLIAIFIYCTVRVYRRSSGQRFFMTLFLAVAFVLNVFVFVFTNSTMVPRYYITIFIFALPVQAFFLEGKEKLFDKYVMVGLLGISMAIGTAKTTFSFLTVDKNQDKREVSAFLAENGYKFGFASYWNANIITELTNGEVEIANISNPENLEYFKWSSPMEYYQEGYYGGEIFLLLTVGEEAAYWDAKALETGSKIYEDGKYAVYLYEDVEELISCAE